MTRPGKCSKPSGWMSCKSAVAVTGFRTGSGSVSNAGCRSWRRSHSPWTRKPWKSCSSSPAGRSSRSCRCIPCGATRAGRRASSRARGGDRRTSSQFQPEDLQVGQRPIRTPIATARRFAGIAPWVGIHAFDWLHVILGDVFISVQGCAAATARPDYPACASQAAFLLAMKNGGVAAVTLDYLRPESASTHGDERLRIAGTGGVIETALVDRKVTLIAADRACAEPHLAPRAGPVHPVRPLLARRWPAPADSP